MGRVGRVVIVGLLFLVGACSSTTFLYNRLDFIVPWYVDDYVDLSSPQKKQLEQLLQPFLSWHRREELPRYLALLDRVIASLDEPPTVDTIAEFGVEMEAAWLRLEAESVNWLLELGSGLDDRQLDHLIAKLEKDQQKYEKKYLERDEEEYREDLYDGFLDNARDYLGRLDFGQRALAESASAAMLRSDAAWLSERAKWLEKMRGYLRREPGWQQAILDGMALRNAEVSAEYREVVHHNVRVIQQLIADLLASRSDQQDRRLRKKLGGLREDLQTLIEQGN